MNGLEDWAKLISYSENAMRINTLRHYNVYTRRGQNMI